MGRQPIVRDPKNYKYYIPYDMVARTGEPGKEFFPEYISGNLRISNPGTARAIAEAARVVRFLWLEDVWLTGYIAQYLHIQHQVGDSSRDNIGIYTLRQWSLNFLKKELILQNH